MTDADYAALVERFGDVVHEVPGLAEALLGRPGVTETARVMGGAQCVEGTRVPAETVLTEIRDGATPSEVLDSYETLPEGDVAAALVWDLRRDQAAGR